MSAWPTEDLDRFGGVDEIQITSPRPDGSFRREVIIWIVRLDDALYVRSALGPDNPWYRAARASGHGRIRAGSVERDVTFADADPELAERITAAYHAKYDRYPKSDVDDVVSEDSERCTSRVLPA